MLFETFSTKLKTISTLSETFCAPLGTFYKLLKTPSTPLETLSTLRVTFYAVPKPSLRC